MYEKKIILDFWVMLLRDRFIGDVGYCLDMLSVINLLMSCQKFFLSKENV